MDSFTGSIFVYLKQDYHERKQRQIVHVPVGAKKYNPPEVMSFQKFCHLSIYSGLNFWRGTIYIYYIFLSYNTSTFA